MEGFIMKEQLRAWLYCRIDAPEDVHGVLKGHKKELSDYAEQMGFAVEGSSEDLLNDITSERPGWKRFMEAVSEGAVDVLLVYSLSRISRNICRTIDCLEQLRQSGVVVYSPLEGKLIYSFQKTMQDVISHSGFQQRSEEDM